MEVEKPNVRLLNDLVVLIEEGKKQLAFTANATITLTYWRICKRINSDVLENQRADYGKQIVVSVTRQLTDRYGKGFEDKNMCSLHTTIEQNKRRLGDATKGGNYE